MNSRMLRRSPSEALGDTIRLFREVRWYVRCAEIALTKDLLELGVVSHLHVSVSLLSTA